MGYVSGLFEPRKELGFCVQKGEGFTGEKADGVGG